MDAYPIPATSGIYKITCTTNNRCYIGSAINLRQRRNDHFSALRRKNHRNRHLQRAWNKYGEQSFIFEVIELVLSLFLLEREQYWLDKLKPFGNRGFNIAIVAGSSLGLETSQSTREKQRIVKIGKPSNRLGVKLSKETRDRISLTKTGHKFDSEVYAFRTKTFIVTSPDGTEYTVHGLKRFCEERSLSSSHLVQVAKGKYKQHKGWKARYPEAGKG